MNLATPPKADELEISIIGPGRGECIIMHLGDNDWCVVDSCVPPGRKEPVAKEYLDSLGVNALDGVKLVLATHWHDDHIGGIASILESCPNAQFCCSGALDSDNFSTLVGLAELNLQRRSGVDEFAAVYKQLLERYSAKMPPRLISPMFAIENRHLMHLSGPGKSFESSIVALSPSDGTVKLAFGDLAAWLPKAGDPQQRIINRAPNHTSIALWVHAGDRRVLLGADLEHTNRKGDGWVAVLDSHQDKSSAEMIKVPHHGSTNADFPDVWLKMLVENPVAIVTPFLRGVKLPKEEDLERLSSRTDKLYCTASKAVKPPNRESLVEKKLRQVVKSRQILQAPPGHVRVRWSSTKGNEPPRIEMFNGAYQVQ